jgi:hypothetical protein
MNITRAISSAVSSAIPTETSDAGAVAPASVSPVATGDGGVGGCLADSFDAGPPRFAPDGGASVDGGVPVSASSLFLLGAQALAGPIVVSEPIATERTPRAAPDGLTSVRVDVPWYSQFHDHGAVKGGNTSCNPMVKEMMRNAKTPATPGGKGASDNINIAKTKDTRGRIEPNVAKAQEGLRYINSELESGRPVMVGVMWKTPHPGFNGGNADHYVVITGRSVSPDGTEYYTFHDPGAKSAAMGSDTRAENRLVVDKDTNMLFRPLKDDPLWSTDARYEVSQVRKNQEAQKK